MLYEMMARGTLGLPTDDPGYVPSLSSLQFEAGWYQLTARVITRAQFETSLNIPAGDADLTELITWYGNISVTTGGPAALDTFATNVARMQYSRFLVSIALSAEQKAFGITDAASIRQRIIDMRPALNAFDFDPNRP